jgi:hypothetical protein
LPGPGRGLIPLQNREPFLENIWVVTN